MNKLRIITGTTSGIGLALTKILINQEDTQVIGISRSASEIKASNYRHIQIDLSESFDTSVIFQEVDLSQYRSVALINNAGLLGEIVPIGEKTDIAHVIQVNLTAPMELSNAFIASVSDLPIEKILIHISSGAATRPYPSWAVYCATKAGLEMFSQSVNQEQAINPYPVYSFAIAPGVVDTNMQKQIRSSDENKFKDKKKFVTLYQENQLFSSDFVAEELNKVLLNKDSFPEKVFRIVK
ncbi:MAG: SDR family NAD(P)-dependent oxidoreductase [Chitinophagales bacterium]|jgi:benzil reductase ((S)-benzoin forming)|nr:SDR family NAD(P)-dependent oxidoreductase [Chitinophagales bacterium]